MFHLLLQFAYGVIYACLLDRWAYIWYNKHMKSLNIWAICALAAACTGCIGSSPTLATKSWVLESSRAEGGLKVATHKDPFPAVRLASVTLRQPYDTTRLCVMRSDGTVPADPFNTYACSPVFMLRSLSYDAMASSGVFERVIEPTSAELSSLSAEIIVKRLALDCSIKDSRRAVASVSIVLLDSRKYLASAEGEGSANAKDGDYSSALSSAYTKALANALGALQNTK